MENNENTAIVTLDLSAAFDTVNPKMLIKVLENNFGIQEKESNWIMSYLQNRQFQVHINGTSSEKITINYSGPQESILGLLLFNCYSSMIQEIMSNNLSGYADDHSLTESFKPGNTTIKEDLECKVHNVRKWMIENPLKRMTQKQYSWFLVPDIIWTSRVYHLSKLEAQISSTTKT